MQLPQTKNETPATVEPNATASTPATVESDPTATTPTQPSTRSRRKVHLLTSEECLTTQRGKLFTRDLETILQINSNCVIFGDFNATHSTWNCSHNSTRGNHLNTFTDNTNLEIAFPASPTRYGYNSLNTLDFALISNFNFPYTIESIPDLSSDHNPVMLSFNLTSSIHKSNPRAITTCWSAYKLTLKIIFICPTMPTLIANS
ncbi:hypothetical protein TNCV_313851 [Trichonephila clavipes]|nr:hypothetical protein TNCV_313851 [Trichonephila clavipes]